MEKDQLREPQMDAEVGQAPSGGGTDRNSPQDTRAAPAPSEHTGRQFETLRAVPALLPQQGRGSEAPSGPGLSQGACSLPWSAQPHPLAQLRNSCPALTLLGTGGPPWSPASLAKAPAVALPAWAHSWSPGAPPAPPLLPARPVLRPEPSAQPEVLPVGATRAPAQ